jgi:hypothetical protein
MTEKRRRIQDSRWRPFDDESRYVDRFGWLLIVTSIAVVVLSLVDLSSTQDTWRSEIGLVLVSVFVGATLLLSLRSAGVARRYRLIADVIIGIGVVATILIALAVMLSDDVGSEVTESFSTPRVAWVVLAALAPLLVVRRLIRHERASASTLLGAVSAYLLVALAFNFAFLAVDAYGGVPFFGEEEPTTSFMYFSLVTLTTLGYGDLSAVEPFGRLLSTIEAVIGQVYLVTFVAMIVGLLVEQRQRQQERTETD